MAAQKNEDDLDGILAGMNAVNNKEEGSEEAADKLTSAQEDTPSSEDAAEQPAADESKKAAVKKSAENKASSLFNRLSAPLSYISKSMQKQISSFPWKTSLKMQLIGFFATLFLLALALVFLHYSSPQKLTARDVRLSSQIIDVPQAPKPVALIVKQDGGATTNDTTLVDKSNQPQDDAIPLQTVAAAHGNEAPYDFYRLDVPAKALEKEARIAVIIAPLGLNENRLQETLAKAPNLTTLAFSPYADQQTLANMANSKKFEKWMILPTETRRGAHDPGIFGLYNSRDLSLNNNALTSILNKYSAFTGFVIPPYSAFPKAGDQYKDIIERIYNLGYGVADASFTPVSPQILTLGEQNFPYFQIDVAIDNTPAPDKIAANLRKLEVIAEQDKQAIGIMHPYPVSIDTYKQWAETLDERGFVLVPLSSLFEKSGTTYLNRWSSMTAAP